MDVPDLVLMPQDSALLSSPCAEAERMLTPGPATSGLNLILSALLEVVGIVMNRTFRLERGLAS
jgi:hypothetical protein